jgi:hypothetical protein
MALLQDRMLILRSRTFLGFYDLKESGFTIYNANPAPQIFRKCSFNNEFTKSGFLPPV